MVSRFVGCSVEGSEPEAREGKREEAENEGPDLWIAPRGDPHRDEEREDDESLNGDRGVGPGKQKIMHCVRGGRRVRRG